MHCLWPLPPTAGLPSARGRPGWEVPTPDRVFPWAPKESGSIGPVKVEDPRACTNSLETSKGGTPHLREVVSPVQPQGILASKPSGQSPTPCTSLGLGNGDPGTWKETQVMGELGSQMGDGEAATEFQQHPWAKRQRRRVLLNQAHVPHSRKHASPWGPSRSQRQQSSHRLP